MLNVIQNSILQIAGKLHETAKGDIGEKVYVTGRHYPVIARCSDDAPLSPNMYILKSLSMRKTT